MITRVSALLGLTLALLLLPACGATRHPETGSPGDFALGVTVLGTKDAPTLPRSQRPAQYLLQSDGVLRVAIGAGVEPSTYPPRVRRLSQRQVERVWSLVQAAGITQTGHPGRVDDIQSFRPTPRDGWALLDVTAKGERHAVALRVDEHEPTARLVDELADLAWIRP